MKYYKCVNGAGWGAFEANKIYDENTKTEGGTTIRRIKERGLFGKDFEEVSYADYLKQEYDAGRISIDYIGHKLLNGDINLSDYFLIFSNKTNNMEELKLEKNKVIETYNNGCSEVKKTLEGLFGKETFKSYAVGNIFCNKYDELYLLAQTDAGKINLITLRNGNRYFDAVSVSNIDRITIEELLKLNSSFFTKFKFVANNYKDLK